MPRPAPFVRSVRSVRSVVEKGLGPGMAATRLRFAVARMSRLKESQRQPPLLRPVTSDALRRGASAAVLGARRRLADDQEDWPGEACLGHRLAQAIQP